MRKKNRSSEQGVALIIVLSLVAVMAMLAMVFFSSTAAESQSSQSQSAAQSAQQLASSAAQIVMAQIQLAGNQTAPGNSAAVAWASQPGLLRTFTPSGPSTVYKLYSDTDMVTGNFSETNFAPPSTWKSSPAIYCDLNAPVARAGTSASLAYPIADPSAAGVVPGFAINGTAPGYSGSNPSPTNNPLPMPVRWLYVLKNGQLTTPSSVDAGGNVTFTSSDPQPSAANPVVGRIAFWADDETCKVNINTAGYAKNDANYWTYWDTPVSHTADENNWLSSAQPWTNEFLRYPGHPATTGLNVVFSDLNLTDEQIANLTPRYRQGGTKGGTVRMNNSSSSATLTAATRNQTDALKKTERLYPTVDEFFYDPARSISNSAGIPAATLEQRRFLMTSTSRAPETTLLDTPRVTIWPTWRMPSSRFPGVDPRTAVDRLIAFCSTIAPDSTNPQPFYFVRESPLATDELTSFTQNLNLYRYLQEITGRNLPGVGGNFLTKYAPAKNRDQILTSIYDAIRLANLDDRTGAETGNTGYSFTAGLLNRGGSGKFAPANATFNVGYVAPPSGPNDTRGAGRASTLAEVALLFGRVSANSTTTVQDPRNPSATVPEIDIMRVSPLYGFATPSMGMVIPGQNRRIVVEGLDGFSVTTTINGTSTTTTLFPGLTTWTNTQIDMGQTGTFKRNFGDGYGNQGSGLEWTMSSQRSNPISGGALIANPPPTANIYLPYVADGNFTLNSGNPLTISVFSPAASTTPLQIFQVTFPANATVLTPMPLLTQSRVWQSGNASGVQYRWGSAGGDENITANGDTIVAMQSRTGDHRSEILRDSETTITDFRPHARFGQTSDLLPQAGTRGRADIYNRRASSIKSSAQSDIPISSQQLRTTIFGAFIPSANPYGIRAIPALPGHLTGSIQENFPPGDFNNGPGSSPDGAWLPKTDEGRSVDQVASGGGTPYFRSSNQNNESAEGTLSSPNRQMPSAVFFGSVPTGVFSTPLSPGLTTIPWRTLLFRPGWSLPAGGPTHFGATTSPPDWFLLDFFHMPVVEPYAISEPFSTAGKINMNSRVVPFSSYLTRETALHALLQSTRLIAIPDTVPSSENSDIATAITAQTRWPLNIPETLTGFTARYDGSDGTGRQAFLTAGEICSLDLVPVGFTKASLSSFWADKRTTGDNSREQPYASLLPRLTAKSNSYTVHVTAQALAPGPGVVGWQEGRGKVLSEWRGAYAIERYVDPNDARFTNPPPDPSDQKYLFNKDARGFLSGTQPVGPYYRFRVLGTRRFNP